MLAKRGGLDLAKAYAGDPRQLRQQLRPRDREPADPQRQLRHRLHHGPRLQGPGLALGLGRDFGVPLELAGPGRADLPRARARLRRQRLVADGGQAARGRARHRAEGKVVRRSPKWKRKKGRKVEIDNSGDARPRPARSSSSQGASMATRSDLKFYRPRPRGRSARWGWATSPSRLIAGHEPCGGRRGRPRREPGRGQGRQRVMDHYYCGCGVCKHCRAVGWSGLPRRLRGLRRTANGAARRLHDRAGAHAWCRCRTSCRSRPAPEDLPRHRQLQRALPPRPVRARHDCGVRPGPSGFSAEQRRRRWCVA